MGAPSSRRGADPGGLRAPPCPPPRTRPAFRPLRGSRALGHCGRGPDLGGAMGGRGAVLAPARPPARRLRPPRPARTPHPGPRPGPSALEPRAPAPRGPTWGGRGGALVALVKLEEKIKVELLVLQPRHVGPGPAGRRGRGPGAGAPPGAGVGVERGARVGVPGPGSGSGRGSGSGPRRGHLWSPPGSAAPCARGGPGNVTPAAPPPPPPLPRRFRVHINKREPARLPSFK